MKFKAKIKYNFIQSREAKLMNDRNIIDTEIEFTFQDLVGKEVEFQGKTIKMTPDFSMRELVIPWLKAGNIPELIKEKPECQNT